MFCFKKLNLFKTSKLSRMSKLSRKSKQHKAQEKPPPYDEAIRTPEPQVLAPPHGQASTSSSSSTNSEANTVLFPVAYAGNHIILGHLHLDPTLTFVELQQEIENLIIDQGEHNPSFTWDVRFYPRRGSHELLTKPKWDAVLRRIIRDSTRESVHPSWLELTVHDMDRQLHSDLSSANEFLNKHKSRNRHNRRVWEHGLLLWGFHWEYERVEGVVEDAPLWPAKTRAVWNANPEEFPLPRMVDAEGDDVNAMYEARKVYENRRRMIERRFRMLAEAEETRRRQERAWARDEYVLSQGQSYAGGTWR